MDYFNQYITRLDLFTMYGFGIVSCFAMFASMESDAKPNFLLMIAFCFFWPFTLGAVLGRIFSDKK